MNGVHFISHAHLVGVSLHIVHWRRTQQAETAGRYVRQRSDKPWWGWAVLPCKAVSSSWSLLLWHWWGTKTKPAAVKGSDCGANQQYFDRKWDAGASQMKQWQCAQLDAASDKPSAEIWTAVRYEFPPNSVRNRSDHLQTKSRPSCWSFLVPAVFRNLASLSSLGVNLSRDCNPRLSTLPVTGPRFGVQAELLSVGRWG